MASIHVLIIGAGVGGLAFAQGLKRRGISFSVSERDELLDSRLQGYRIKVFGDMKGKLHELLTPEAWTTFEATCAQTFLGETNLNAADASVTACRRGRLPPGESMPYTVDRGLLRQALMTGIEPHVQFGKQFDRYELVDCGVKAFFKDGSAESGTLLVGADGSHSMVRRQFLPYMDPVDTGIGCIYGKSPLGAELQKQFPGAHRRWITVVKDQTPTIQSIIFGDGPITMISEACHFTNRESYPHLPVDYVHWGLLFRKTLLRLTDEKLDQALTHDSPGLSLDITSEWAPSIRSLIELQDRSLTCGMRVYSAKANTPKWTSSAHVTVLGDAAHVMSPSGGVGAVAALNDSFELMKAVAEEGVSAESLSRYEQRMRAFAGVCIWRSNAAAMRMLDLPLVTEAEVCSVEGTPSMQRDPDASGPS